MRQNSVPVHDGLSVWLIHVHYSKIYIRTKFAWYILAIPSHEYQHIYQPYWIQHQIFHLLLSAAMRNPDITYDRFVESLGYVSESPDAGPLALDILGRHVNEGDFEEDDVVRHCFIGSANRKLIQHSSVHMSLPHLRITSAGSTSP